MFRITGVLYSGVLAALLASCTGSGPTAPAATDEPMDGPGTALAQSATSSATCNVSSSPEFTVTVSWSKLPVQRIVLWHSLLDRSSTLTLDHQAQKGTLTAQIAFEPVLAVYYDRAGVEVARRNCA